MSEINIQEKTASRKWGGKDGDTLKVDYKITGTEDSLRAYIEFCCYIQSHHRIREGLFIQTMDVDAREEENTPFTAHATWTTENIEMPVFTGNTIKGRKHITQSLETASFAHPLGLVGIQGIEQQPGEPPKGCDIIVPAWSHTVKFSRLRSLTPDTYFAALHHMTGTVNNAPFWFFRKGEVLFTGVEWDTTYQLDKLGNRRTWINFTYHFEAKPNETIVHPRLGTVHKDGQHYLWYRYEAQKNNAQKVIVPWVTAILSERVYEYSDFSFFGFGGPSW